MYCTSCGNKINDGDKYCTNCGIKLDKIDNVIEDVKVSEGTNGLKIASIILGIIGIIGSLMFIFAPFCLIVSIIGLVLGFCALKKGSNVVGILLSSIGLVLSIIMSVVLVLIFIYMIRGASGYINENYDKYYEYFDNYKYESFGDINSRF